MPIVAAKQLSEKENAISKADRKSEIERLVIYIIDVIEKDSDVGCLF